MEPESEQVDKNLEKILDKTSKQIPGSKKEIKELKGCSLECLAEIEPFSSALEKGFTIYKFNNNDEYAIITGTHHSTGQTLDYHSHLVRLGEDNGYHSRRLAKGTYIFSKDKDSLQKFQLKYEA